MKNLWNKMCTKEMIMKILMFFIIIQPLLDIYILFDENVVSLFHFSPSTIIRIFMIAFLGLLSIWIIRFNKHYLWIILYGVFVFIYVLLHHINAGQLTSRVPGNFGYSFLSEVFYIVRMLLPLTIMFISYHLCYSKQKIKTIIFWLVILFSGSIVITNLFGISLSSYTNKMIEGTIFDWFLNNDLSYEVLASKGYFTFANQIAAVELFLTPFVFYFFMKDPNKKNFFLVILQLFASFMVGTKVSTLGFVILFVVIILLYLFFSIIKKELLWNKKIVFEFGLLALIIYFLLPASPMLNRNQVAENIEKDFNKEEKCKELVFDKTNPLKYQVKEKEFIIFDKEQCKTTADWELQKFEVVEEQLQNLKTKEEKEQYLSSFIGKEFYNFRIYDHFVKDSYPYQYDPYFWYEIMHEPVGIRMEYRVIEEKMLKRVKDYNQNKKDDWLGISYTRMSNIFNLERDFLSHYYSLGVLGLLLFLAPYFAILAFCLIYMLWHFKEKVTLYHCTFALSIGIVLFAAYYSGNIMDGLVITLILGFFMGQFLNSVLKKENIENNEKVSVIMPTYNDALTITASLDSLKNQTYQNWELIIVDDGSTDDTKKVIETYQKEHDKDHKITYIYQENTDQLKAIIHGIEKITGDYVFVLHSDDLLASKDVLKKSVSYMERNKGLDAIIADLLIINEHGKVIGRQNVLEYQKMKKTPVIQLLWLGRNLYVDVGFYKKETYVKQIKENYLIWNMPFWLNTQESVEMLNVENVSFELLKYRVHSGNYINNEIGKHNVMNGELRTVTRLMHYYEIPNYSFQYILFRIFSKLGLVNIYYPVYKKRETKDKAKILDFVIRKRFKEGYQDSLFLNSLVQFYKNEQKRKIDFSSIYHGEEIYKGNEMRKFNKQLKENQLPEVYIKIMEEMKQGFNEIVVKSEEEKMKALDLVKFLCIDPYVKITKK